MTNVITHGGLTIAKDLFDLVNDEILANSAISADRFWSGLDKAVHKLAPKNLLRSSPGQIFRRVD